MNLKEYLHEQGISASECARQIGVAIPTISRILQGERGPSLRMALRISKWSGGKVTLPELDREGPSYADPPFGIGP